MTRKIVAAALMLTLAGMAHAEGPSVIQTRQAGQDLLAGDYAGIRAVVMLKGDVKTLQKPAAAIARWMKDFPEMFPPGSDTGDNTKALPAIWSDNAGFRKDAADLVDAADKLQAAAKAGDEAGVKEQVEAMNHACSGCHHSFRAQ